MGTYYFFLALYEWVKWINRKTHFCGLGVLELSANLSIFTTRKFQQQKTAY